jgi:hypothetical protein
VVCRKRKRAQLATKLKLKGNATELGLSAFDTRKARCMSCDSAALDTRPTYPSIFHSLQQLNLAPFHHITYPRRTQKHLIEKVPHHLLLRSCTQVAASTRLAGCACSHKVCEGPQQLSRSSVSTGWHVRRDSEIYLGMKDQGCGETFQTLNGRVVQLSNRRPRSLYLPTYPLRHNRQHQTESAKHPRLPPSSSLFRVR